MNNFLFPISPNLSKDAEDYVKIVETEFANGGLEIFAFELDPNLFKGVMPHERKNATSKILSSKEFEDKTKSIWPESNEFTKINLEEQNIYHFFYMLCSKIQFGGAYSPVGEKLSSVDVIKLSNDFFFNFLEDPMNYYYFFSFKGWTPWFYNVAWDYTAILLSKDFTTLKIICITDTD